ncbi:MAG: CvpA family protein [Planctomycetia bacterium]
MIITLVLLAILAAVTGMLVREGLWRALLMFFNVLVAATVATAWHAPLAGWLEGQLPSYTYLLDFLSIWGIFCASLALLREATDRLAPTKIEFPKLVERIGVGIPAFLAGWIMMAFTAASLHTAPIPRNVVQPTPEARMFLGLAPDRKWLAWVRGSSRWGPFSRPDSVFDERADFILRHADRRLKLEGEAGLRVAAQ